MMIDFVSLYEKHMVSPIVVIRKRQLFAMVEMNILRQVIMSSKWKMNKIVLCQHQLHRMIIHSALQKSWVRSIRPAMTPRHTSDYMLCHDLSFFYRR
jgi:hypothetical protein